MIADRFDKFLVVLTGAALIGLASHLAVSHSQTGVVAGDNRALERELTNQARAALLEKLFAPVTAAMDAGQLQEALLKLEEVNRRYPGEAHGFILKGEILARMGVSEEAAASFVHGVKLNGDYIDRQYPQSRRPVIKNLVESSSPGVVSRLRNNPGDPAVKLAVANLNYLKSRLAGGCE